MSICSLPGSLMHKSTRGCKNSKAPYHLSKVGVFDNFQTMFVQNCVNKIINFNVISYG